MLQAGYERGTKDSDILETAALIGPAGEKLLSLAGKNSDLSKRYGIYLDIVGGGIPFLPVKPVFNALPVFAGLKNFKITALDITDVAVSKLKRFTSNDTADIRAVVEKGLINPGLLGTRLSLGEVRLSLGRRRGNWTGRRRKRAQTALFCGLENSENILYTTYIPDRFNN